MTQKEINIKYKIDDSDVDRTTAKVEKLIKRTKELEEMRSAWFHFKMSVYKALYIDRIVEWLNKKL